RPLPLAVAQWLDLRERLGELDQLLDDRVSRARTEGEMDDALCLKQRLKRRLLDVSDEGLPMAIEDALSEVWALESGRRGRPGGRSRAPSRPRQGVPGDEPLVR